MHVLILTACLAADPSACADRLLPAADGVARIGRMAVLPVVRGSGVGRQVLPGERGRDGFFYARLRKAG